MKNNIKKDFPIFSRDKDLIYLDNASTTQKPSVVIDSLKDFYERTNANVHRGLYPLSQKADVIWKTAHSVVAKYINATFEEVFFVKNATEGLNWIAQTISNQFLESDDVIVISEMEHHSNLLPWKKVSKEKDCILETLPVTKELTVDISVLEKLFNKYGRRIKVISLVHMSNVLGSINDIEKISEIAHKNEAIVIVDGTQSIAHKKIDVRKLDCDVFTFSGHKVYGPLGVGVVYAKQKLLEEINPVIVGGEMVDSVNEESVVYKELPFRFEAGTPNIEGAYGLTKAIQYLENSKLFNNEEKLSNYMYERLEKIPNIKIISKKNTPILSFYFEKIHSHDIAYDLGLKNICVRSGYHCAEPLHNTLSIPSTVRISLGVYNSEQDIDILATNLENIVKRYE